MRAGDRFRSVAAEAHDRHVGPHSPALTAVSLAADDRGASKDEFRRRLGVGDAPFELAARAWVVTGRV
jgi:aromatic ring-cleaving dioxygenase